MEDITITDDQLKQLAAAIVRIAAGTQAFHRLDKGRVRLDIDFQHVSGAVRFRNAKIDISPPEAQRIIIPTVEIGRRNGNGN